MITVTLTDEQARLLLDLLHRRADASVGEGQLDGVHADCSCGEDVLSEARSALRSAFGVGGPISEANARAAAAADLAEHIERAVFVSSIASRRARATEAA